MRYLPAIAVILLFAASCTKTASLRASRSGVDANTSSTIRDPYSGTSATVRADDDDGVTTSSSGPSYTRYRAPVVKEQLSGVDVSIDTSDGSITSDSKLGKFFITGDDGGLQFRHDADRWEFCDACYLNGVSMYVDSDDGVHVSEPSVTTHNDYVRAGLNSDNFDVVWTGQTFSEALDSLNGIVSVRLDANATEDGFEVSAVPQVKMTLLDVSADYAVHRLAAHADLEVYVDESEEFVLKP